MVLALTSGVADRILIVDDEATILFAVGEYFAAHGAEVDCAQDLAEAQGFLSLGRYAAIIADLSLSGSRGTEGLELARWVRERDPSTRVIILTAYGSAETEREARRLGASGFLRKPLPLSDIATIVFDLIRSPTARPAPPDASGVRPGGAPASDPETRDR